MSRLLPFLLALCLAACSSTTVPEGPDASASPDAEAVSDAGSVALDASSALPDAASAGPDAGSADTGPGSSHGQGKLTCESTGTVSQSGVTYSFCLAKVAGVELKIIEPTEGAGLPLRLAVYLHGDGAGPHNSGFALRTHAPWTTAHRTLYVSAKAPNGCAWWLSPSYTTCDGVTPVPDSAIDRAGENATALVKVLEALRAGWDLADAPVLFGGSSGGSIFLTSGFLPAHGDRFPGVYALSCGGDEPWAGKLSWSPSEPAKLGPTKLFFTYGDKDFVVPDVEQSVAFYTTAGVPLETKVIPETGAAGSTHCGNVNGVYSYNQLARVTEVWSAFVGE